ncbi:MAG: hypothetical protein ACI9KS_000568 [Sulfitobacter sp.]|jgi:hypothetical protein
MAVSTDIAASYRGPRRVMRRILARGASEGQALMLNLSACLVIYIAQWPRLSRDAFIDPSIPLEARLGGALIGLLAIAPLMFYGIAALSHLIAKLFRGKGDWLGTRIALFWSLLVVSPIWLLHGLVAGFIGPSLQLNIVGGLLLAAFFYIWISNLIEAEQAPTPSAPMA